MAKKDSVPTYETDEEIHAARQMHGAAYDRLIASKAISAPTREELPDTELAERIAKVTERKAAKGKRGKRAKAARKSSAKKASKRPSRAKTSKAVDAPASESTSSE